MWIHDHPKLVQLDWNKRVLTLDDFYEACERDRVRIIENALLSRRRPGAFFYRRKRPFIALDYRLRGPKRTLVAWHEYGHHLYHTPGCFGLHSKTELQADRVAYPALIPVFMLHYSNAEIRDMLGYPLHIIEERVRMWQAFNE